MHEHQQLARWRKKIGTHQDSRPGTHAGSQQISTVQTIIQKAKGLSKKQKIALLILLLVATGLSLYYIKQILAQKDDVTPGRKLLRSGGLKEPFQTCTLQSAKDNFSKRSANTGNFFKEKYKSTVNVIADKNLNSIELRQILSRKINIDKFKVPDKYLNDFEKLKSDFIEYYISDCNQQLLYLIKTPVTFLLTPTIATSGYELNGRYEGATNIIIIRVPIIDTIVSSPNSLSPYEQMIRTVWHEGWHSIMAAMESGVNCDAKIVNHQHMRGQRATRPMDYRNPKEVEDAIKKGDKRLFNKLGKLVAKKNKKGFNHLSLPEQAQYSRYQQQFSHYIPRRNIAELTTEDLTMLENNGALENISRGISYKIPAPNSSISIFVDEIHYEHDPKGVQIIGTGYHLANPNDKLSAIVADTQWRNERFEKMYEKKITAAEDPYIMKVTELDGNLKEMGTDVLQEFYEEVVALHFERESQSRCQVLLL